MAYTVGTTLVKVNKDWLMPICSGDGSADDAVQFRQSGTPWVIHAEHRLYVIADSR